jgi:hypothetical protein
MRPDKGRLTLLDITTEKGKSISSTAVTSQPVSLSVTEGTTKLLTEDKID